MYTRYENEKSSREEIQKTLEKWPWKKNICENFQKVILMDPNWQVYNENSVYVWDTKNSLPMLKRRKCFKNAKERWKLWLKISCEKHL